MTAAPGNGSGDEVKPDRQAGDAGPKHSDIGEAVLVGIAPVLDRRHQAPAPQAEHGSGHRGEDGTLSG